VNGYLRFVAWTKAKAIRFVAIWGVLFFGGSTFIWSLTDGTGDLPLLLNAGLHVLEGLFWGLLMWLFLNWRNGRPKVQQ